MSTTKKRESGALVYSTAHGRMCPECGAPVDRCSCRDAANESATGGVVRVSRSTKGRKGKGVTVIAGLSLGDAALAELGRELKKKCGSGGTVKNRVIEIQGDHRDLLVRELGVRGYTVRGS